MEAAAGGEPISRRGMLAAGIAAVVAAACGGNGGGGARGEGIGTGAAEGRLRARPGTPSQAGPAGLHPLGLERGRDGFVYVPASYSAERPAPLAVVLHGAGGGAREALSMLRPLADGAGLVLLSPDARASTWDAVAGRFGPDVAFVDRALAHLFRRWAVDPARLAVAGFSDGASYALSLGVTNGDLFSRIVAFSPGFIAAGPRTGAPRVFVSHGTRDEVLPIDRCSRRIVPQLRRMQLDVVYREFDGPHTVPPAVAREAVEWLS